jgi:hypothetical protein
MTYREALRRLINDLDEWNIKVYGLRSKTDAQTKKNINRWLNELIPIFYGGVLQASASLSYDKIKSTLGIVGQDINVGEFTESYFNRVRKLSVKDYREASLLRNGIAKRFKNTYKDFYKEWDLTVQNYSAKPLRDVVKIFEKKAIAKNVKFVDKAGKTWSPKHYGSMYARTRSAEVSDALQTSEMEELGLDIVQISNANTITPICTLFEDKYFSLSGKTKGLPKLEVYPPFHPNCRHIKIAKNPKYLSKYIAENKVLDKQIKAKQGQWTDAQKRAVDRQMDYLKANQSV